jgi:4-diphosphocytidyl-2-C-methyl-D-erythritol kinase
MVGFPKSKINLGLRITGKRDDGYHDIETVFYPVNLCEALEYVINNDKNGKDILTVTGHDFPGIPEDNLVLKVVRKLRNLFDLPYLKIHLHKAIPAGAGLGGGSSDAASALKMVNRHFGLAMSPNDLKEVALEIGSDCPFFIDSIPSLASGRGEILEPVSPVLKNMYILLLNPEIKVSTREAYEDCIPSKPASSLGELIKKPVSEWKGLIVNDFEKTVFKMHPDIGVIKNSLYDAGALFSSMSGSGSTVYGIFPEKPEITPDLKRHLIYEGLL